MTYDFSVVLRYWDALAFGLWTSIELSLISFMLGTLLGFAISLARASRFFAVRWISILFVELFRGTPVLIQLFWIFYCLPLLLGIELSNQVSAVISLTLFTGAITSETFRSSLKSIGSEQMDACVALGLSPWTKAIHVVLPQALLRATPALLSNGVALFKESALVSAVGMADLMFIAQGISNRTARPVEVLTVVACVYFVVAFPLTRLVTLIEKRVLRRLAV